MVEEQTTEMGMLRERSEHRGGKLGAELVLGEGQRGEGGAGGQHAVEGGAIVVGDGAGGEVQQVQAPEHARAQHRQQSDGADDIVREQEMADGGVMGEGAEELAERRGAREADLVAGEVQVGEGAVGAEAAREQRQTAVSERAGGEIEMPQRGGAGEQCGECGHVEMVVLGCIEMLERRTATKGLQELLPRSSRESRG